MLLNNILHGDYTGISVYHQLKLPLGMGSFEGGLEKANSDGIISPAYHTFHGENTDSRFLLPVL